MADKTEIAETEKIEQVGAEGADAACEGSASPDEKACAPTEEMDPLGEETSSERLHVETGEDIHDVPEKAQGELAKAARRKRIIVGSIAAACVLALVGGGIAWATMLQPTADIPVVTPTKHSAAATQVADKQDKEVAKHAVNVTVKVDGMPADATPAKAAIYTSDGAVAIEETELAINKPVKVGELAAGDYELHLTLAPVAPDGSTAKLPEAPVKFTVAKDKDASVEATLEPLAVADMSKEQLEAVSNTLEVAGKTEAAGSTKQAAQAAPSRPGSAVSVTKPAPAPTKPSGGSGGGSTPSPQPGTPQQPSKPDASQKPAPESAPPVPSDPNAGKSWHEAVYEQRWVPPVTQQEPDYAHPKYVYICKETGAEFSSEDAMWDYVDANEPKLGAWHVTSRTEYPQITVTLTDGYYEQVLVKEDGWY